MNADFLINELLESKHLHSSLPNGLVVRDPMPGRHMKGTLHLWAKDFDGVDEEELFIPKTLRARGKKEAGHLGMSYRQAELLTGGLSHTSKMPGESTGYPAWTCQMGMKLHSSNSPTTCKVCYSLGGNYGRFPKTAAAYLRRYDLLNKNLSSGKWTDAMATMLHHHTQPLSYRGRKVRVEPHFRWNDSGDVQSTEHVAHIMEVARKTMGDGKDQPKVNHWLATREGHTHILSYIDSARKAGIPDNQIIPENMVVRISHPLVDEISSKHNLENVPGIQFSTLTQEQPHYGTVANRISHPSDRLPDALKTDGYFHCPAPMQGTACGSCRNCWDRERPMAYTKHGQGGAIPSEEFKAKVQAFADAWHDKHKAQHKIKDLDTTVQPKFSDHHNRIMGVVGAGGHKTTIEFHRAVARLKAEKAAKLKLA